MIRPSIFIGVALLLSPSFLISEAIQGKELVSLSSNPPLEILFSWMTSMDTGASVLVRLEESNDREILQSRCASSQDTLRDENGTRIIQWKLTGDCALPLVSFRWANYIFPINGALPSRETLSDLSTETLKNTLRAGTILQTDYRLASLHLREFFRNISSIIEARESRFIFPITNVWLPTNLSYLPNSPRPFRSESTDGIHHGWDFYTDKWTPVKAVEAGKVIHVKRDFNWNEMQYLHVGNSELNRQENLDIYRGNTVYLKTLSGHVAIYAHLSDIPENIQVGTEVHREDIVGHVGDSAVPDKKYLYHLHFEIAINPLKDATAGTYDFDDILLWPFWWKGKGVTWVSNNDDTLFE